MNPFRNGPSASSIPAAFYRGGTSNALMIQRWHLPDDESHWEPILAGALGSPDSYERQLNGMGGGISSLSKVCVVEPSCRLDADVDFTFVQVGVIDGAVDTEGTCGNMTAAVGPFAVDEKIIHPLVQDDGSEPFVIVRIFNTNTNKIVHSRCLVEGVPPCFKSIGEYSIDGVPGTGSRVTLTFLSPGGSKTGQTLPTNHPVDCLEAPNPSHSIRASLVDIANPAIFVFASDFGISGSISPRELDENAAVMATLENVRQQGARMMGLDPHIASIPKIAVVSAAQ